MAFGEEFDKQLDYLKTISKEGSFSRISNELSQLVRIYESNVDDVYRNTLELFEFLCQRDYSFKKPVAGKKSAKKLPVPRPTRRNNESFESVSLELCSRVDLRKPSTSTQLQKKHNVYSQERPLVDVPLFENGEQFADKYSFLVNSQFGGPLSVDHDERIVLNVETESFGLIDLNPIQPEQIDEDDFNAIELPCATPIPSTSIQQRENLTMTEDLRVSLYEEIHKTPRSCRIADEDLNLHDFSWSEPLNDTFIDFISQDSGFQTQISVQDSGFQTQISLEATSQLDIMNNNLPTEAILATSSTTITELVQNLTPIPNNPIDDETKKNQAKKKRTQRKRKKTISKKTECKKAKKRNTLFDPLEELRRQEAVQESLQLNHEEELNNFDVNEEFIDTQEFQSSVSTKPKFRTRKIFRVSEYANVVKSWFSTEHNELNLAQIMGNNPTWSFAQEDICRLFLSTLHLANEGKIDINGANDENCVIRLLDKI